jgi:UPF0716 protein FxsA
MVMAMRLFLVYVLIELAAVVALTYTIGFGWTVLVLAAVFALGIALAGSQVRRQITQLQRGMRDPSAHLTDSALVALGGVLMVIPGLVTSSAGLLMLLAPTRSAMRPLAGALATRALARRIDFADLPRRGPFARVDVIDGDLIDADYIDGEVVDTSKANLPAAVRKPE